MPIAARLSSCHSLRDVLGPRLRSAIGIGQCAPMQARQSTEADMEPYRIAVLWRGDREARCAATPQNNRYHCIFEELAALGIHAEPAVYDEAFAAEVCEQLLAVDGVLVWVDPISRGTRFFNPSSSCHVSVTCYP